MCSAVNSSAPGFKMSVFQQVRPPVMLPVIYNDSNIVRPLECYVIAPAIGIFSRFTRGMVANIIPAFPPDLFNLPFQSVGHILPVFFDNPEYGLRQFVRSNRFHPLAPFRRWKYSSVFSSARGPYVRYISYLVPSSSIMDWPSYSHDHTTIMPSDFSPACAAAKNSFCPTLPSSAKISVTCSLTIGFPTKSVTGFPSSSSGVYRPINFTRHSRTIITCQRQGYF
nr:MAG TPA: hypothetical protein [Caudoviricetes sp.]